MKCKTRKRLKKSLLWLLVLGFLAAMLPLGVNAWVVKSTGKRILTPEDAAKLSGVDCILVLGCGVDSTGQRYAL